MYQDALGDLIILKIVKGISEKIMRVIAITEGRDSGIAHHQSVWG